MEKNISEETLKDALIVLEKAIKSIKIKDINNLELLSNQTIHNATTEQDILSITIPKILYGIFKISRHSMLKNIPFPYDKIMDELITLHDLIGLGQISKFKRTSAVLMSDLRKIGQDIHLDNVIDRAGIKKGSKIYDHGVSIAIAANTMNVSQWELYPYIGKSKLNDYPQDIDKRVKQRLAYTRSIFL
jgi:hypothetical protein